QPDCLRYAPASRRTPRQPRLELLDGHPRDASEADVAGRGVERLALPSGGSVAEAVVRRAEVGAALDHPPRDRLSRRVALLAARHSRVAWDTARFLHLVCVARREEVGRPLPDVPGHVVEAVAVRRERAHRRRPLETVELQVLPGELPLPAVRHGLSIREVLVAPGENGSLEATAGRVLPFGFGRELLAGPGSVGRGILIGDVHDRMTIAPVDRRARTLRSLPVGTRHVLPPVAVVAHVDWASGLPKDEGARNEHIWMGARVVGRIDLPLAEGDIAGVAYESPELPTGYGPLVDQEAVDGDPVHRPLLRIEVLRAHQERAARNPAHTLRRWRGNWIRDAWNSATAAPSRRSGAPRA